MKQVVHIYKFMFLLDVYSKFLFRVDLLVSPYYLPDVTKRDRNYSTWIRLVLPSSTMLKLLALVVKELSKVYKKVIIRYLSTWYCIQWCSLILSLSLWSSLSSCLEKWSVITPLELILDTFSELLFLTVFSYIIALLRILILPKNSTRHDESNHVLSLKGLKVEINLVCSVDSRLKTYKRQRWFTPLIPSWRRHKRV